MAKKMLQLAFAWDESPPDSFAPPCEAPVFEAPVLKTLVPSRDRGELVRALQQQIARAESSVQIDTTARSTGVQILDRLLPAGGLSRGVMVEWLAMNAGGAASYLSLAVAAETLKTDSHGGVLLVIDRDGVFYPPAATALGIPPERLFVVRPAHDADALWAIDQGLRCSAVTVVWSEVPKLDSRAARRLQLAAEQHNGLFFSVRPAAALDQPSWAEVRWQVQPLASTSGGRRMQVDLVRCRGGRPGASAVLEIDDQTGELREIVPMNRPITKRSAMPKTDITAAVNLAAELSRINKRKSKQQATA